MDIRDKTVLLGKNNEGKTNVLRALMLTMDILKNAKSISRKSIIPRNIYDWQNDYPIHLQDSKTNGEKYTTFRLDFELTSSESQQLYEICGSNIRKTCTIKIYLNQNNGVELKISKRGKNTLETLSAKLIEVCSFITDNLDVQYVPAIRSEKDAIVAITSLVESEFSSVSDAPEEYIEALNIIRKYQDKKLDKLSSRLKSQLAPFIPKLKRVKIKLIDKYARAYFRKDIDIEIDDGVLTNLNQKGDGIKSLVAIALLSQVRTSKNRIIIVDEPENHLHPEAIHYIKKVLYDIPENNQVIISTHSPIFVNRIDIGSNIIVKDSKAEPAQKIDDVRKILGTLTSDNLQYADYVIVVEGPTDRTILYQYFKLYQPDIVNLIDSNKVTIRSIGGVKNLKYEVAGLERYYCNYLILLDYDKAGRDAKKDIIDKFNVDSTMFRFFNKGGFTESELEDLYEQRFYREYLFDKNIDITKGKFQNRSKKWSSRIKDVALDGGIDVDENFIEELKHEISDLAVNSERVFTDEALDLLNNISKKVREDITAMGLK